VTGKLEAGETFDAALAREVQEEIGLQPTDYTAKFLLEKDFNHPDGELRRFGIYLAKTPHDIVDRIHIDTNEVAGVQWFSIADVIKKMQHTPNQLVPSANTVWPATFEAIWPDTYKAIQTQ
jgi:8-oxo-dGTP pyrophosphatase MutT (NUDIX family)